MKPRSLLAPGFFWGAGCWALGAGLPGAAREGCERRAGAARRTGHSIPQHPAA